MKTEEGGREVGGIGDGPLGLGFGFGADTEEDADNDDAGGGRDASEGCDEADALPLAAAAEEAVAGACGSIFENCALCLPTSRA